MHDPFAPKPDRSPLKPRDDRPLDLGAFGPISVGLAWLSLACVIGSIAIWVFIVHGSGGSANIGDSPWRASAEAVFARLDLDGPAAVETWVARVAGGVGLAFAGLGLGLMRFPHKRVAVWRGIAMPLVGAAAGLFGLGLVWVGPLSLAKFGAEGDLPRSRPHLEVCVHASSKKLGVWNAVARRSAPLKDGRVSLTFASTSALKEVRFARERTADNRVHIVFSSERGPPVEVLERECERVTGSVGFRDVALATRRGTIASGELHMTCPAQGFSLHATLDTGYSQGALASLGRDPLVRNANLMSLVVFGLLSLALGIAVQTFALRRRGIETLWMAALKGLPAALLIPGALHAPQSDSEAHHSGDPFVSQVDHLTGYLSMSNDKLGVLQAAPERCHSGREDGFRGVRFALPSSGSVRELRIDTERQQNHVVELRFFDPNREPVRFHQNECELYNAEVDIRRHGDGQRATETVAGAVHMTCAKYGLDMHASFVGCGAYD